jgi:hypothetical protein
VILLSLLLVLGSLGLLIGGLAGQSVVLVWASIVASLVAGGCLAVAVLRRPRLTELPADSALDAEPAAVPGSTGTQAAAVHVSAATGGPGSAASDPVDEAGSEGYPDPPDEPAEEDVSAPTALRVVDLDVEVVVVDGRPRYHLDDCPHLDGRETVPLPVNEARESGFTPCSLCKPDATLVARAARASDERTEIVEVPEQPGAGETAPAGKSSEQPNGAARG